MTADQVRALREHGSAEAVGVVQALENPTRPTLRLLDQAKAWPDSLPGDLRPPAKYRTMKQLRPDEIDKLVEAYQAGATVYTLAPQFGINRTTIGKHLRDRGIDTTPPGFHPDDVPTAAHLYRSGWSLARIAEKFNASDSTVRARLIEAGVEMRPQQGGRQRATP